MKKTIISLTTFSIFSSVCLSTFLGFATDANSKEKIISNWVINKELKFHYAHVETPKEEKLKKDSNFKIENFDIPDLAPFSKPTLPDITNISLKGILDLGFPLPTRDKPENYKFFLKFYDYPSSLDPKVTSKKILTPFLLSELKGNENIFNYVNKKENVYIKDGFIEKNDYKFSRTNPYPILKVPMKIKSNIKGVNISSQELFDSGIPFSSLYVKTKEALPKNALEKDKISWSSKGLKSIHSELVNIYKHNYTEVKGIESQKYYYFIDTSDMIKSNKQFTLIKLLKDPMIFDNVKDLPMPNDPDHIFLSGLLLVFKTTYTSNVNQYLNKLIVDSNVFKKTHIKTNEHILEVGSVVNL